MLLKMKPPHILGRILDHPSHRLDLAQILHLRCIDAQSLPLKDQQVLTTLLKDDQWATSLMTAKMVQTLWQATQASASSEQRVVDSPPPRQRVSKPPALHQKYLQAKRPLTPFQQERNYENLLILLHKTKHRNIKMDMEIRNLTMEMERKIHTMEMTME